VDSILNDMGGSFGIFSPQVAPAAESKVNGNSIAKQYLMASLRSGQFIVGEPVAVDITGRMDVDYDNSGPEISTEQQMISAGYLLVY
jgi:hypothetical protein